MATGQISDRPIPTNIRVELSQAERQEIDLLLQHASYRSGVTIDALRVVQSHRGWVSDAALAALASYLHFTQADIESVATFYNLIFRQPVGDVILHPCNGISCDLMGGERVRQCIGRRLGIKPGETTKDNRFTLIPLPCLGACDKAPVMQAQKRLYEALDEAALEQLLVELGGKDA